MMCWVGSSSTVYAVVSHHQFISASSHDVESMRGNSTWNVSKIGDDDNRRHSDLVHRIRSIYHWDQKVARDDHHADQNRDHDLREATVLDESFRYSTQLEHERRR